MKTIEEYFADWEGHVFGYGYGTGEWPIFEALKVFFETIEFDGVFNYEKLEKKLSPTVAWLLINILCHADILEYGTSPRFPWLTATGKRLRSFVSDRKVVDLVQITMRDRVSCTPDFCNCDDPGPAGRCLNPFWCDQVPG